MVFAFDQERAFLLFLSFWQWFRDATKTSPSLPQTIVFLINVKYLEYIQIHSIIYWSQLWHTPETGLFIFEIKLLTFLCLCSSTRRMINSDENEEKKDHLLFYRKMIDVLYFWGSIYYISFTFLSIYSIICILDYQDSTCSVVMHKNSVYEGRC